ncbi:hypothetical protein Hanom_Chr11g00987311 [Helianthus anomalus]
MGETNVFFREIIKGFWQICGGKGCSCGFVICETGENLWDYCRRRRHCECELGLWKLEMGHGFLEMNLWRVTKKDIFFLEYGGL